MTIERANSLQDKWSIGNPPESGRYLVYSEVSNLVSVGRWSSLIWLSDDFQARELYVTDWRPLPGPPGAE